MSADLTDCVLGGITRGVSSPRRFLAAVLRTAFSGLSFGCKASEVCWESALE